MKSIWKKILVLVILPFLFIYIILLAFITYQVYQTQVSSVDRQLQNQAIYSETNLKNIFRSLEYSVQIAVSELEKINPDDPYARQIGENIISSRFQYSSVINVWLAFEPNAFDARDDFYTDEYPGAPSGRYFRFFTRDGNSFRIQENIEETVLYDRENSYWYNIPRETRTIFVDLGEYELLRNFGTGYISSLTIAAPVFRNNTVIGCVGLNAVLNEETLGGSIYPQMILALFFTDGRLAYSLDMENAGISLEDFGFGDTERIRNYMERNEPVFMYNLYSGISGSNTISYFYPVQINGEHVYIYTAIPVSEVLLSFIPVLLPIGFSLLASLVIFSLIVLYLSKGIAAPLKKLSIVSEAIVDGNLDQYIGVVNSDDEMGMISASLFRMAEQFRTSKLLQERYYDRYDIIMQIHYALFRSSGISEAFNAALVTVSEYYKVYKALLIFVIKGVPKIAAVYPVVKRDEGDIEFFAHNQVAELLNKKKILVMNSEAIKTAALSFIDYNTQSLCILPMRMNETLQGYIILEGKNQEVLIHDNKTLFFMGDAIKNILNSKIGWEEDLEIVEKYPPGILSSRQGAKSMEISALENTEDFLSRAKTIQNLNVEKGILLIGGEKEQYTELLKTAIKVISEDILKMRRSYIEDISAFAIEIHGMKAVLYNIGAEALGDEARQLEFAAKSDDTDYCKENYPLLEEKLRTLSRNLTALFPLQEQSLRPGSIGTLAETLKKVHAACENFDINAINTFMNSISSFNWDSEIIQKKILEIVNDMENLEYNEMSNKLTALMEMLKDKD